MARVFNFGAGPATLPEPVLEQAAEEMLDWHGSGMSVMEMSHRGKVFIGIHAAGRGRPARAPRDTEELQGAVPAGRRRGAVRRRADEPAARQDRRELRRFRALGRGARSPRRSAIARSTSRPARRTPIIQLRAETGATGRSIRDAAYVHYTSNETIGGVEFHWIPDTGDVPLVADASSHILSRPLDVSPLRADLRRRAEEHRPGRDWRSSSCATI